MAKKHFIKNYFYGIHCSCPKHFYTFLIKWHKQTLHIQIILLLEEQSEQRLLCYSSKFVFFIIPENCVVVFVCVCVGGVGGGVLFSCLSVHYILVLAGGI